MKRVIAMVTVLATSLGGVSVATSAPLSADAALKTSAAPAVETVQWRGRHHHHHHHHGYGYRGYRGSGWGPAIGGLAAGAIIGGAIASSQAQAAQNAAAYCAQRFRSYDPASGTYLGTDGYRHPCP